MRKRAASVAITGQQKPLLPKSIAAFLFGYSGVFYTIVIFLLWRYPKYPLYGSDFFNIWSVARLALQGRIMDVFNNHLLYEAQKTLLGMDIGFRPWFYPLHFLPWVMGLSVLPFVAALVVYLALTFAGYVVAVVARRPHKLMMSAAMLFSPAGFENLVGGQNGYLTAALFVGGLRLLKSRPVLAGVLLGFLSVKPQLFFLVPLALVAGRQGKALAAMAVTILVMIGLSLMMFGFEAWQAYIQNILPAQRHLIEAPPYHAFVTSMAVTPFMALRMLGAPLGAAYGVAAILALIAMAAATGVFYRKIDLEISSAVLITATFLASPYLLTYDMTAFSAVVLALLLRWRQTFLSWGRAALLLVVWVLPLAVDPLNGAGIPVAPLIVGAFFMMLVRMAVWESNNVKSDIISEQGQA